MDWGSLSRLAPEAIILIIVGYFAVKALKIFQAIVDKIDTQHHDALSKLSESIDRNTASNRQLIAASKEQTKASKEVKLFMQNLNGRLTKATQQTIKEHDNE